MAVLNSSEDQAVITAQIPSPLRAGLEQSARENDRSLSAEVRRALTEFLTPSPSVVGSRGPTESRTHSSSTGAGGSHSSRTERAVEARARRGVDTKARVLHVRRVYTDGRVKEYGKQSRSVRRIPLRARAIAALEAHPWRIDTSLVYPGELGGHMNLHAWRRDEWYPALDGAGLPHLVPYAMRHTFASFAIAAGVSLFYLARLMGSSVEQIDRTYGHMLPDSEEYLCGLLDIFDSREHSKSALL